MLQAENDFDSNGLALLDEFSDAISASIAVGKTVLGTAQLSNGKAKFTASTLAVGSTKVTATYYGNSNIAKSSAQATQTVHQ